MHPKQRQELRSAIRQILYYLDQMQVPRSEWADKIEQKINLRLEPGTTDAQYFAFKAEVRTLIEEMIAAK